MGQAQINVRTRACSRTSIARTKQAALTHNVRGKELRVVVRVRVGLWLKFDPNNLLIPKLTLSLNPNPTHQS